MNRLRMLAALLVAAGLSPPAGAADYVYPDAELMNAAFATEPWGSGSLVGRDDLPGPGVRFRIELGTAADNGKTVIGDDWPVASTAGLAWDDGGGYAAAHDNVSIAAWDRIAVPVRYVSGPGDAAVKLFMNTGLTGPSGYPPSDWHNNTAWTGAPLTLSVGETATLILDFDNAQAWGIGDNPFPHTASGLSLPDGTWYAVNDRDRREVTNLGFEVYDASGQGAGQEIVLDLSIPEPATLSLLAAGGILLLRRTTARPPAALPSLPPAPTPSAPIPS